MNTSWQDRARCAETDPEAFYPEKGGSVREAKRVCRSCEVRFECLAWALERPEPDGIWGGLSPMERREFRRHLERLGSPASPAGVRRILRDADACAATYAAAETDRELGPLRLEIAAAEYGGQKRRAA